MFTIVVKDKEQLYLSVKDLKLLKRQQNVEYIEYGCTSYVESCYAYTNPLYITRMCTRTHTHLCSKQLLLSLYPHVMYGNLTFLRSQNTHIWELSWKISSFGSKEPETCNLYRYRNRGQLTFHQKCSRIIISLRRRQNGVHLVHN